MIVREAVIEDLPQMLEIYNDVILNTTAVYDYEAHTLEMRIQWFETKQQQGFPVFVAEENGEIVGFSSIGPFRAWAAYKYLCKGKQQGQRHSKVINATIGRSQQATGHAHDSVRHRCYK